jgi:hypothetical protein
MEPADEPKALDYRDGKDDLPQMVPNAGRFVFGGVIGAGLIGFAGLVGFGDNLHIDELHPHPPGPVLWNWIIPFAVLSIAGLIFGVFAIRKPRRRFLLAGFLLGLGVCALCEGICFSGLR